MPKSWKLPKEVQPDACPVEDELEAIAKDNPRYRGARVGETVREYRERLTAQLAKNREKAVEGRARQRKEEAEKSRLKELRALERRLAEQERLEQAIERKALRAVKQVDLAADILWVYQHMNARETEWIGAPSKGALGLLISAREDRKAFYQSLLPKALAIQEARERAVREKEQEKAREEEKRGDKVVDLPLAEVERLLWQFAGKKVDGDGQEELSLSERQAQPRAGECCPSTQRHPSLTRRCSALGPLCVALVRSGLTDGSEWLGGNARGRATA